MSEADKLFKESGVKNAYFPVGKTHWKKEKIKAGK